MVSTPPPHGVPDGVLETLPRRPPTPPRGSGCGVPSQPPRRSTPQSSPGLASQLVLGPSPAVGASRSQTRKRVAWAPWETNYHKAPVFPPLSPLTVEYRNADIKPLTPSRERTPFRSILKAAAASPSVPDLDNRDFLGSSQPYAAMLESTVRQLAGSLRSGRLEAYMTLNGSLRELLEVPDVGELRRKMPLLMQFTLRDLAAPLEGSLKLDTPLITQAIKVIGAFLCTAEISDMLTDDFREQLLSKTIELIPAVTTPKSLIAQYLHLLVQQRFTGRIMTVERSNMVLDALLEIEARFKSNSIVRERILIYQRLLGQARTVMVNRVDDWMRHLFSAMLSGIKEVRSRAITFGIQAAINIGTTPQASFAVKNMFKSLCKYGVFGTYLVDRLHAMLQVDEEASHVPQIWSVVVLMLRSRPQQLELWDDLKPWCLVIQTCFNSADPMVRYQTNIAWSRFISAINLSGNTSSAMRRVLRTPTIAHLRKKTNDKLAKQNRQFALSSWCCLLYYALRPGVSIDELDMFWDEYVVQVVDACVSDDSKECDRICEVVSSLFDADKPRRWSGNRTDTWEPIMPDEIPRLQPTWVRSQTEKILHTCETMFRSAGMDFVLLEDTPRKTLWRNLCSTIAEAGNKEIKASDALLQAVSQLVDFLGRIWSAGPSAFGIATPDTEGAFIASFRYLVETAMQVLGPVLFSDMSIRADLSQLQSHSPVIQIFQFYNSPPDDIPISEAYFDAAKSMLELCCMSRTSSLQWLDLIQDCLDSIPCSPHPNQLMAFIEAGLWTTLAEIASTSGAIIRHNPLQDSVAVGIEYAMCARLLHRGCKLTENDSPAIWSTLLTFFAESVAADFGDAGLADAVIRPVSQSLLSKGGRPEDLAIILFHTTTLLELAAFPEDPKVTALTRKRMWGGSYVPREQSEPDSISCLLSLVNAGLKMAYSDEMASIHESLQPLFAALEGLIVGSPASLLAALVTGLQDGLKIWIEDPSRYLSQCGAPVKSLWQTVIGAIQKIPSERHPSSSSSSSSSPSSRLLLQSFESLALAGLQSRNFAILSTTILTWNKMFSSVQPADYPDSIRDALIRLSHLPDLDLPTFSQPRTFSPPLGNPTTSLGSMRMDIDTGSVCQDDDDSVQRLATSQLHRELSSPESLWMDQDIEPIFQDDDDDVQRLATSQLHRELMARLKVFYLEREDNQKNQANKAQKVVVVVPAPVAPAATQPSKPNTRSRKRQTLEATETLETSEPLRRSKRVRRT
ncbi:MAG: hypothetical protein M1825_005259 [Sarcosagium campestre]|nr:MAG: hypothetical protein M1825_005259 [Sarcosagium campestre]